MARVRKLLIRGIFPALLIVVMMAWLVGAFRSDRIEGGEVSVVPRKAEGLEAYTLTPVRRPVIWQAVGTVQPDEKTAVSAKIVATVLEIPVKAGQQVREGDLLVRLDDRDLRSRLAQAKDALRRAQVTRDIARRDYERDKDLVEKQAIPPVEFDHTRLRLETAEADVARLENAVKEAEVTLSYAEIHSPYDGVVIDTLADAGDLAAPGRVLLTLYERGRLMFEAAIPEQYTRLVRVGRRYRVHIDSLDRSLTGAVTEYIPSADPASRTMLARVSLPDVPDLYPGMFGRMDIETGAAEHLLIPETAVIQVGQITMVDVIENGLLRRRSVQLGRRSGGKVEVLSGLAPGERIALRRAEAEGGAR